MPEDIKKLSEEVAKMGATIIDMILAWCKESGHNPYFILGIITRRLYILFLTKRGADCRI